MVYIRVYEQFMNNFCGGEENNSRMFLFPFVNHNSTGIHFCFQFKNIK